MHLKHIMHARVNVTHERIFPKDHLSRRIGRRLKTVVGRVILAFINNDDLHPLQMLGMKISCHCIIEGILKKIYVCCLFFKSPHLLDNNV